MNLYKYPGTLGSTFKKLATTAVAVFQLTLNEGNLVDQLTVSCREGV